ncbi:uncharacterized protein LOC141851453 [Brevipalpus obovatus]|uniref:uncharacterized protein LOC141851453 n=1 Tax=Brevipalpus obovatus TaxID=246614 RepID=UPI003D9F7EF0
MNTLWETMKLQSFLLLVILCQSTLGGPRGRPGPDGSGPDGSSKEQIQWLCNHHFKPSEDRHVEIRVKFENCMKSEISEKMNAISNCAPKKLSESFNEILAVCDSPKREANRNKYLEVRNCLQTNKITEDEFKKIKKCALGETSRKKRGSHYMLANEAKDLDEFCTKRIDAYYYHHPDMKEVFPKCMEKLYPAEFKKHMECESILQLSDIEKLKKVCDGEFADDVNKKIACEKDDNLPEEARKKVMECATQELSKSDWDRAARMVLLTPHPTFDDFCGRAWALPMGNMSEHHNLWMKVELSEARVNLEKYVKRRNCRKVNMQLACRQMDKYQEDFKQMAECEKQNSFTPEEMDKIKENLRSHGIDPSMVETEINHEQDLKEFCRNHKYLMIVHEMDYSKESIECAEEKVPGIGEKFKECRKTFITDGSGLKKLCEDRAANEEAYQKGKECIESAKPDTKKLEEIMECAIQRATKKFSESTADEMSKDESPDSSA